MSLRGVTFQPGPGGDQTNDIVKAKASVQEAIKILSMRLPKQVGPNALAPAALLNAQGSGGNPRIDSVVNTVMGRMFPTGEPTSGAPVVEKMPGTSARSQGPTSSTMPPSAPVRFDGNTRPPDTMPLSNFFPPPVASVGPSARAPRIMPAKEAPTPGGVRATPGTVPAAPPPPQRIDYTQPGRPAEPAPPSAPTQDPWNDLLEYLRRNSYEPAPPQEMYSI